MVILGVEFLALLFMIVYVGAIAILFLFVVMMLNIKLEELKDNATRYVPIGLLIGFVFIIELLLILESEVPFSFSNFTS
jgi:NADH-quinone oxidoreductase subunit J